MAQQQPFTGKSDSVSYGDTAPFSWLLVHIMFHLCPLRVCFPSPVVFLKSNPTGLKSQIPWGFSVPLPDPQVGKSVVGPRTFLTKENFFGIIVLQFVVYWLLLYWQSQRLQLCRSQQSVENSSRDGNTIFLLRNLYAGQEATVRTGHGTTEWLQIGKGVHQGCILSPDYLTSMQSTSCKMPVWLRHKLQSRFLGEISITSDMHWIEFPSSGDQ